MALLPVAEAHARLLALFAPLALEEVPLTAAAGRVLARDVVAARAQPPFAASAMDGYALRAADATAGARLAVVGTSAAGARFEGRVGRGEAVRIFTGAPIPDGADFVVIQEDTDREEDTITIRDGRDGDPYIRPAGGDFAEGARLAAPRRLRPADLALIAAMNTPLVAVARRPVVALIPTGDELVMPGEAPGPDQIVASNGFGLKAMLEAAGAEVRLLPIARDTPESLAACFALAAGADLIVTLGGASVGDLDLVQETAVAHGLAVDFYKIAMRPGKPLMAGRFNGTPLVGLPGNPVSAMVCGQVFLVPAVERMQGLPGALPETQPARLGGDLGPNGPRAHYMRALIQPEGAAWRCTPFGRQDSSLLSVLAEANALLVRPPRDPARREGDEVAFLWI
jgi:molybdopterin molybdotransferase